MNILRFPSLRGPLPESLSTLKPQGIDQWAQRFWPGLPEEFQKTSEGFQGAAPKGPWFYPESLPYSPQEAAQCLNDVRQLADVAASGLSATTLSLEWMHATKQSDEAALRKALANQGVEAASQAYHDSEELRERRHGQRLLLWCWLQEERISELVALSNACTTTVLDLHSDEAPILPADFIAPLSFDRGLLPPWQRVLAAAIPFLPEQCCIVAEDTMQEDLWERFSEECQPCPQAWERAIPKDVLPQLFSITHPAWEILGRPRAPKCCPAWHQDLTILLMNPNA